MNPISIRKLTLLGTENISLIKKMWVQKMAMCPINDGVEDTEHFLLHCRSYHPQRNSLLGHVKATLLSYGLLKISNEESVLIIYYGDEKCPT